MLKLATLPNPTNKAAVILALCLKDRLHAYVSPEVLAEYQRVLASTPRLLEEIQQHCSVCLPLFTATAISHEPDNRILECALACQAQYLITVNTASGHLWNYKRLPNLLA